MKTICNYCGSLKEGIQTGMCEYCGKLGKTNRKLALEWWNTLYMYDIDNVDYSCKRSLSNKYFHKREPNSLTESEIEHIWRKEVNQKPLNELPQEFTKLQNKQSVVDFEMLDNSIYNLSKANCLNITKEEYNNIRLFFELLIKSSSFAHKAHKELQRLS